MVSSRLCPAAARIISVAIIALNISAAQGQSLPPSAAKTRPSTRRFSLLPHKQAPTAIQLSVSVPIPGDISSEISNLSQFKECSAHSSACAWTSSPPWPFKDIILDRDTGMIAGTPSMPKVAHLHITAIGTDDEHHIHEADVIITITPGKNKAPAILSSSLPNQPVGQSLSEHFTVLGGTGPYFWSKGSNNTPPPGVDFDDNGNVYGTPTTPGTYTFDVAVRDASGATAQRSVSMVIDSLPDCDNPKYDNNKYYNGWFPISRDMNVNPLGDARHSTPTDIDVQCFYGTSGLLSPVSQVQYIYGFDGGANTISADLLSVQMPAPIGTQVSLGTSVTGGGSNTTTIQALQSVEAGGNFFVHVRYPIAIAKNNRWTFLMTSDPKVGFNFNGFAGQATLSQATEQYFSVPVEMYGEYFGLANAGGAYVDYRAGFESVPPDFASAAGLTHHNFALQQIAFGFNFAGLMRVGAQHFFGPRGAFNAAEVNDFNKWHFVVQLAPKSN